MTPENNKNNTTNNTTPPEAAAPAAAANILLIAKCPIPGASKTRLVTPTNRSNDCPSSTLAIDRTLASEIARSLLSDVIYEISKMKKNNLIINRYCFYAPDTDAGLDLIRSIVRSVLSDLYHDDDNVDVDEVWTFLPLKSSDTTEQMRQSNLGDKLADALVRARDLAQRRRRSADADISSRYGLVVDGGGGASVFLGMDSPELPVEEVLQGIYNANFYNRAHLCPSEDGGYGMLVVPSTSEAAADKIFQGVLWSHPLTALSQLKALSDCNIDFRLGKMMRDVDQVIDLKSLAERLCDFYNNNSGSFVCDKLLPPTKDNSLLRNTTLESDIQITNTNCKYIWNTLLTAGLVIKKNVLGGDESKAGDFILSPGLASVS